MRQVLGVTLFTAIGLGLVGCDSAPPAAKPAPPKVSVAQPVSRELTEYDNYNGWIDSPETVQVRSRVRGHIMKVNFQDGDMVKKDQVLFELDPRPLQQDIDRSIAQVRIFQTQLDQAKVEQKRMEELAKKQAATALEVEQATVKAEALGAQVDAQKEEVERNKLELVYAHVPSPIAGRIGKAQLDVGNLVNAGGSDPLLATVVSFDPVHIYFDVDERALQRYQKMKAGATSAPSGVLRERKMKFLFGLETDEGYPNEGMLDFADNKVDPTTGTIQVRGIIANPQGRFIPGSRVRVRLPMGEAKPAQLIPDTAILSDQDRKYVLIVGKDNIVERKDIKLGRLMDDGMRIVLPGADGAGLGADDTIITEGLQTARLHYPVEPVKPAGTPAEPAAPAATQPATASR